METKCDSDVVDQDQGQNFEPIVDIIDYLVRCANISFKNAHVDEQEIRTSEKVRIAYNLYQQSPTDFLMQFGKKLASHHITYFENLKCTSNAETESFKRCIQELKVYHSEESRRRRTRNRRYKALEKMKQESDYFTEKEMMYRNPLLYEQLVGQYLSEDEIKQRDNVDHENLTLLNMILETVDRNEMRETKNKQMIKENLESDVCQQNEPLNECEVKPISTKKWGDFETPDTQVSYMPEKRKQTLINGPERRLLREEFFNEMFTNFLEGRDPDIDYRTIDNDEQYDDLLQVCRDAEDKYFDSVTNEVDNLEEHMNLINEYKRPDLSINTSTSDNIEDPLDEFMRHINKN